MIPRSDRGFTREKAVEKGYDKKHAAFFCRLVDDFSDYRFILGTKFKFRPPKTIVIGPPFVLFFANANKLQLFQHQKF